MGLIGQSALDATPLVGPECAIVPTIPYCLHPEHYYLLVLCGHLSVRPLLYCYSLIYLQPRIVFLLHAFFPDTQFTSSRILLRLRALSPILFDS